jgi:hypothetical protein
VQRHRFVVLVARESAGVLRDASGVQVERRERHVVLVVVVLFVFVERKRRASAVPAHAGIVVRRRIRVE